MDSPLLLALSLLLSFIPLLVQSQGNNNNNNNYHVSQTYHLPPPPHAHRNHLAPKRSSHHSNSIQPATDHRGHRNGEKHNKEKHTVGKQVGFCFLLVAAALQVCAAAFLIFKRRQLFKDQDIFSWTFPYSIGWIWTVEMSCIMCCVSLYMDYTHSGCANVHW